jgi:dihydrofolate reductase
MRLKADAEHDISVDGPELAAQAIRAGLVDEFQMIVCPAVVGGGKRSFLTTCGWRWSCSRSAGSTGACSSCGTASAGLLVGLHRA